MTIIAEAADVPVREATAEDIPEILDMIYELARNEGYLGNVRTTEEQLLQLLFPEAAGSRANTPTGLPAAYCLVVDAESGDGLWGMALWYLTVSTWEGRYGIHLEDLYVRSEARGKGVGKALVMTLAALCEEHGYPRLEWAVQDSNEHARAFYRSLRADELEEWLTNRLSGRPLRALAEEVDL
ncbi:MAG: GNAT family N-acetyltransferase [Actinobacteria bacterium]|nr:GNAT family N-acetyltransferase [Actinomycetota bacterium]MCB9413624.1 GNAT family N-acetyltransferase [Actinomycetota bacterium]